MKMSKFLILFLLVVMGSHFTSCENEPIDPSISLNPENDIACESPAAFSASNFIEGTKIVLDWESNAETWQVQYGPKGFAAGSGTGMTVTENTAMINGLLATNQYDFYVRTVCDATTFSAWIGPVSAGTTIGSCASPQNGTAVRNGITPTTVTVSWTAAAGTANNFEIQYGNTGFSVGTGTMLVATTPTVTIPGLLTSVGYDFYVRTNCSATSSSTWAGPIRVEAAGTVTTGDYFPLAINNRWVYDYDGDEEIVKIVSLDNVGGNNYYTLEQPPVIPSIQRFRKANGNYYLKVETFTIPPFGGVPSSTITGNETILLKDNLAVGGTWTDTYTQTTTFQGLPAITTNVSILSTIEEKGTSIIVRGVTYSDIIKVKKVMNSVSTGSDTETEIRYYWFAKNVGPVKIDLGDNDIQELKSYTLF